MALVKDAPCHYWIFLTRTLSFLYVVVERGACECTCFLNTSGKEDAIPNMTNSPHRIYELTLSEGV
jgi:hypothetical protein